MCVGGVGSLVCVHASEVAQSVFVFTGNALVTNTRMQSGWGVCLGKKTRNNFNFFRFVLFSIVVFVSCHPQVVGSTLCSKICMECVMDP